jgi:hypothetical protein
MSRSGFLQSKEYDLIRHDFPIYIMRSHLIQRMATSIGLVLIAAFFVDCAVRFMQAEHTIYGWDYMGFWKFGAELAYRPDHSVMGAIAAFGRSMHHDYNDFCALPSACMMALWGPTRFCYVISNVIFLIIPVVFVCLWLFVGLAPTTWSQTVFILLAFVALLAVPLPWVVTLSGMTDVGGLIMAAVVTDLLMRMDIRSASPIRWLAIGGGMAMTALCKRWYLYLVIAWLVVLMTEIAIDFIKTSRKSHSITFSSFVAAAFGPFLCLSGLVGVYCLSFPLPIEILTTNYSSMYVAYQSGDSWLGAIGSNADVIIQRYGLAQVALAFLCFIAALFFARTRRAVLYLYLPGWLALLDFSKVQTMNDHHMLLLYIATAVPPLFLARHLLSLELQRERPLGWAIVGAAVLISCLGFQSVFALRAPFGTSVVQNLFPDERIQPIQRHDLDQIEALMRFLDDKVANPPGQPPVQNVYLLSSSLLLNSSHLGSAAFQLGKPLPAVDYICQTHDVDFRDGFPDALLTARIVLVADPLQTHLKEEQRVLAVPARMFLQGQGFAQAFARDPEIFQLDQGVRVYTFERVRPSTPEEIAQLRKEVGVPSQKSIGQPPASKL